MSWKAIFQKYEQTEIGKQGKQASETLQQVPQFSLFPSNEGDNKKTEDDITAQLEAFLGEDWHYYKDNPQALSLWADAMQNNKLIMQSIAPPSFDGITNCACCGLIFVPKSIANDGKVLGCPWCFNSIHGLPVPRYELTNKKSLI